MKPSDAGTKPPPLLSGLRKAVQHLRGDESAALLAAAWASSKGQDTLELQLVKLLRSEAIRLEKDRVQAPAFALGGAVAVAVAALDSAAPGVAAEAAAALGNVAAAGGAARGALVASGAVAALVNHVDSREAPLATQSCRSLGSACFGGDADPAKTVVGDDGAAAVVASVAAAATDGDFRWRAHCVWNLCVRSTRMQDACGAAPAALLGSCGTEIGLRTPAAMASGLRAVAFAARDHEANRRAAADAGALEAAAAAARADDEGVVAAALACYACVVEGSAARADLALAAGAPAAAVAAVAGPAATADAVRWAAKALAATARAAAARRGDVAAACGGAAAVAAAFSAPAATKARRRGRVDADITRCLACLEPPRAYDYAVGVEAVAAGREPPKNFRTLRRDLGALPWVLGGPGDVVVAQDLPGPAFYERLATAGVDVDEMPVFVAEAPRGAVPRPWGVPGPHLRRSNVARYRDDVSVCETVDDARAAVRSGRTLLKAEYSSSGLGAFVADALDDGGAALRWLANQLRRDGRVTAEPLYDVVAEFTGEWDCGTWVGVSQCAVDHMRWTGQHLGDPKDRYSAEVYAFVFETHAIEAFLEPLDVPGTCGSATCGADVAVVRGAAGLEVRLLEVNARTTMSHFALAAKRRVPAAAKFDVVRAADLRPDLLPLTDAAGATFVAVVELPS